MANEAISNDTDQADVGRDRMHPSAAAVPARSASAGADSVEAPALDEPMHPPSWPPPGRGFGDGKCTFTVLEESRGDVRISCDDPDGRRQLWHLGGSPADERSAWMTPRQFEALQERLQCRQEPDLEHGGDSDSSSRCESDPQSGTPDLPIRHLEIDPL